MDPVQPVHPAAMNTSGTQAIASFADQAPTGAALPARMASTATAMGTNVSGAALLPLEAAPIARAAGTSGDYKG